MIRAAKVRRGFRFGISQNGGSSYAPREIYAD